MLTAAKIAQVALALALPTSVVMLYLWYKNSRSEENTYGKSRVVTSRNIVIEVAVPVRAVGAVIGKQGATIKHIQKETGARLHFRDRQEEEGAGDTVSSDSQTNRTVIIHGSAESAQQAELMIHQIIAGLPEVITEEIEVPQYTIGRIIGKAGKSIKEMSRVSGSKIAVDREESKGPEDLRIITLMGSRQQIDTALDLIQEKLEEEEKFRAKLSVHTANREQRKVKTGATRREGERLSSQDAQPRLQPHPVVADKWGEGANQTQACKQDRLPTKEGFIEVFVSAVEHPGHFWVQVVGTKGLQLEELQNSITSFVASEEALINFTSATVGIGDLVAAKFDPEDATYYRAKVLGEVEGGKVDLYFVDYGDNSFVSKQEIYGLRPDFKEFPHQAIECQLADVEPVDGDWTDEGITSFEDLVYCAQWKVVFIKVGSHCRMDDGQLRPVVQMVNTSGSADVDVGSELVRLGHAKLREQRHLK